MVGRPEIPKTVPSFVSLTPGLRLNSDGGEYKGAVYPHDLSIWVSSDYGDFFTYTEELLHRDQFILLKDLIQTDIGSNKAIFMRTAMEVGVRPLIRALKRKYKINEDRDDLYNYAYFARSFSYFLNKVPREYAEKIINRINRKQIFGGMAYVFDQMKKGADEYSFYDLMVSTHDVSFDVFPVWKKIDKSRIRWELE